MKKISFLVFLSLLSLVGFAKPKPSKYYELRIYYCNEGKLPDLLNRFRNHTTKIFEKHGMENIGYWVPTSAGNNTLYYILGYPSKEARDESWKAFMADPEWQTVAKKSEENGKILAKVESKFMTLDEALTSKIKFSKKASGGVFEMREYFCYPDKFPNIEARFKDHTRALFEKHNMKNIMYFSTIEKNGGQPTLLYFIKHNSEEDAKKSWDTFRADPEWVKVRTASEESGKIVEKVESKYMTATDFSRIK